MRNGTGTKRTTKRLPLFTYLAYILAATVVFVGVTFSSYIATSSGGDETRVAKFEITENITTIDTYYISENLYPGSYEDTKIVVENESEVAVDYIISITNDTGNLPLAFSVYEDLDKDGVQDPGEDVVSVPFTKTMAIGADAVNYMLRVSWPAGNNSAAYAGMIDMISISLTAEQHD